MTGALLMSAAAPQRSATLANIPPPSGPPPLPPQGHTNSAHPGFAYNHSQDLSSASQSSHSSFSSQSGHNVNAVGQLVYPGGPYEPRPSFSSSRASPLDRARSGRERGQDAWSDSNWRSIFDAALVKAQQAVQLDELQETALAANLYAQAASDLGRVIPLCGSERKKQSMLAIYFFIRQDYPSSDISLNPEYLYSKLSISTESRS
ncbi:hypothetical protein EDD21DRAFT_216477 [Dissophora ornata]|nr:hypothetical protein EDD21DRAFT_216477 [Dissophora ornata]